MNPHCLVFPASAAQLTEISYPFSFDRHKAERTTKQPGRFISIFPDSVVLHSGANPDPLFALAALSPLWEVIRPLMCPRDTEDKSFRHEFSEGATEWCSRTAGSINHINIPESEPNWIRRPLKILGGAPFCLFVVGRSFVKRRFVKKCWRHSL